MPKVNMRIFTKNREQFIGQANKSLLTKTYQGFKVLVGDDGSTDQPHAVVKAFCDLRLTYICHDHSPGGGVRMHSEDSKTKGVPL